MNVNDLKRALNTQVTAECPHQGCGWVSPDFNNAALAWVALVGHINRVHDPE